MIAVANFSPPVEEAPAAPATPSFKNRTETDLELGRLRMATLIPYVERRRGSVIPGVDLPANSVRRDMESLKRKLKCGADFIWACIRLIETKGPENVIASNFLRRAPSSRGTLKIASRLREPLMAAVNAACVDRGLAPGTGLTRVAVKEELLKGGFAVADLPCDGTIDRWCKAPAVVRARTAKVEGDHANRVMQLRRHPVSAYRTVILDVTTFTGKEKDKERILYVLDDRGAVLGVGNAYVGIQVATRDIWTVLPFVGAPNAVLTGYAIFEGCLKKEPVFKALDLKSQMITCGKPTHLYHDLGRELVNDHIGRVLDELDMQYEDVSPGGVPEFRSEIERFNRTAHRCFDDFLHSAEAGRYLVDVPGQPDATGIRMRDFRLAMWHWVISRYRITPHKGIGYSTPAERFEDMVHGRRGFPASGYQGGRDDTPDFRWLFLREEQRKVTHVGIAYNHRRYSHKRLAELFTPGTRSSGGKIAFRVNDFAMGKIVVRMPDGSLLDVPYEYERDKLPADLPMRNAIENCSIWEWTSAFAALRRAGTRQPTAEQANAVIGQRIAEVQGGPSAGAPSARAKRSDRAHRAMAGGFGGFAVDIAARKSATTPADDHGEIEAPRVNVPARIQMLPCVDLGGD